METKWRFFKNFKIELAYDLATPLVGIYLKGLKSESQRDSCTPKFIVALFTMTKIWKQHEYSSKTKQNNKENPYMYYGILFSLKKERNPAICGNTDEPGGPYAM